LWKRVVYDAREIISPCSADTIIYEKRFAFVGFLFRYGENVDKLNNYACQKKKKKNFQTGSVRDILYIDYTRHEKCVRCSLIYYFCIFDFKVKIRIVHSRSELRTSTLSVWYFHSPFVVRFGQTVLKCISEINNCRRVFKLHEPPFAEERIRMQLHASDKHFRNDVQYRARVVKQIDSSTEHNVIARARAIE